MTIGEARMGFYSALIICNNGVRVKKIGESLKGAGHQGILRAGGIGTHIDMVTVVL